MGALRLDACLHACGLLTEPGVLAVRSSLLAYLVLLLAKRKVRLLVLDSVGRDPILTGVLLCVFRHGRIRSDKRSPQLSHGI